MLNGVFSHTLYQLTQGINLSIFIVQFDRRHLGFRQNGTADFVANGTIGKLTHENICIDTGIVVLSRWIAEILGVCQLRGSCFVNIGLIEDTRILLFCQTNFPTFGELIWQ